MKDQEKIKVQAKAIMDEFVKALDKVHVDSEYGIERRDETRDPKKSGLNTAEETDDFKRRMLKNAPHISGDYLQMEKKSW
jgi:hypothetical protein